MKKSPESAHSRALLALLCLFAIISFVHAQVPNLLMGNPSQATNDPANADNYLKDYTYFVLSCNSAKGLPNWVSWRLIAADIGNTPRTNPFHPDAALPHGFTVVVPADYNATGFDRGHMCNFKDRSSSAAVFKTTFVMTNMVPQSPRLNEDTWEHLEDYCRQLALDHHHLYIIAGPLGEGGEGLIKPDTITHASHIGKSNVVVPAFTWKVILIVNDAPGNDIKKVDSATRLIAVMMPNNQTLSLDWTKFRVSVHDVEQKTGLRFFTAVPANIIEPLKTKIDDAPVSVGHIHH